MEDKTPSLSEVKDYFKDADKIQSIIGRKFKNDGKFRGSKYAMDGDTSIYAKNGKYEVWNQLKGYAKILSYKEPKEKTYKITREQILELHDKIGSLDTRYELRDMFPEVFETKLTVGKWYKLETNKTLAFITELLEKKDVKAYGFNFEGYWVNEKNDWTFNRDAWIEATHQEVTEALTKETRKRYKVGDYVYLDYHRTDEIMPLNLKEFKYYAGANELYVGAGEGRMAKIFENGKFAEIIPTLTIQEAEAKLKEIGVNAKIV